MRAEPRQVGKVGSRQEGLVQRSTTKSQGLVVQWKY